MEAHDICKNEKGRLVRIESQEELDIVKNILFDASLAGKYINKISTLSGPKRVREYKDRVGRGE